MYVYISINSKSGFKVRIGIGIWVFCVWVCYYMIINIVYRLYLDKEIKL